MDGCKISFEAYIEQKDIIELFTQYWFSTQSTLNKMSQIKVKVNVLPYKTSRYAFPKLVPVSKKKKKKKKKLVPVSITFSFWTFDID